MLLVVQYTLRYNGTGLGVNRQWDFINVYTSCWLLKSVALISLIHRPSLLHLQLVNLQQLFETTTLLAFCSYGGQGFIIRIVCLDIDWFCCLDDDQSDEFLKLEDITHRYKKPCILDVKVSIDIIVTYVMHTEWEDPSASRAVSRVCVWVAAIF